MNTHIGLTIAAVGLTLAAGSAPPVPLQPLAGYNCTALAPAGWSIVGGRGQGDALDIARSDGRAYAAYLVLGVPSVMARTYDNSYATPENAIMTTLTQFGQNPLQFSAPRRVDGFNVMTWESTRGKGFTLYNVFPMPSDAGGFVVAMRSAGAEPSEWQRSGVRAGMVATSIRCRVQLRAPSPSGEDGSPDSPRLSQCDASGYNKELGMEYVHSESGENFWVSPSTDYIQNGPDGPGYYIPRSGGNDYEKLKPGRSDNC
jgi:hypothetical protein